MHSSNEMNLPYSWDHATTPVGFEWFEDGRADRVANVIRAGDAADIASNRALQTDTFSTLSLRIVALLPDNASAPPRDLLHSWDGHSEKASAGAMLFELWLSSHLRPALLTRVAPDGELRKYLMPGNVTTVVRLLEGEHPNLAERAGLKEISQRDAFLSETLAHAWNDACAQFGNNPKT